MSIDNPPLYSGITYNSAFFAEDTGGLSEAQANALYLRKTVTDTATALETFNNGIASASVNSTSSATNMTIGGNLAATQTLTLGSAGTVTVNNGTLQSQSLAPVAPASNLIIGATSTAGINIGNAGVSTTNLYGTVQAGTINTFTTTGTLNLGSTLTTGILNLGTATSTNYIYNLESPSASTNINLYSLLSGANLTLCDGQGTGNFGLGNDSARTGGVNICTKGLGYTSNTINIGAPSNVINVGTQADRTGLISIGSNSASTTSTGGLNLGSVSSGTGSVQLANGTSQTANIIIGNGNAVVTGSDKIIIGKSGKTVSISGATTLDNGTLNLSNATINVNTALKPTYSLTFTSDQIGYSSSSSISGTLVNSTYNNLLMGTLTGVYMISCKSYVAAGSFTGVTTYDFQVGLNGIGEKSRNYLGGSNENYSNKQNTLSMLYNSSGPTNTGSALLYSNVFITWTATTGSPVWGIDLFYTRVA